MKIDFKSLEKSTSLFLLNVICLDSEMPYLRQSYALVYLYRTTVNTRGISKFLIYEVCDLAALHKLIAFLSLFKKTKIEVTTFSYGIWNDDLSIIYYLLFKYYLH